MHKNIKNCHHCYVSRSPVLRLDIKSKNSVLHMTAVFYINCRLVSDLFEIKHARRFQIKTLFEAYMQKNTERGSTCIPLSNSCVVLRRAIKNQFHLPRNSSGNPTHMQVTKKTCLVVSCKHGFHAHAQGLLRPALTAAKMALASSLL